MRGLIVARYYYVFTEKISKGSCMSECSLQQSMPSKEHMLHILPVLQADPFDKCSEVCLSLSVDWGVYEERRQLYVSHRYPNKLYFVGGGPNCTLGILVPVPEGACSCTVTFHWSLKAEKQPGNFEVTHSVVLTLEPASSIGQYYSMDLANWWKATKFFQKGHVTPELRRNLFSRLSTTGISPERNAVVTEETRQDTLLVNISEAITLPPVSELWTPKTYGPYAGHLSESDKGISI